MDTYEFIESTRPMHVTIADVEALEPGDKLDVVLWDRNFEERGIWGVKPENTPYVPCEFYAGNRATFTCKGDMRFEITLAGGSTINYTLDVNVERVGTGECMWSPIGYVEVYDDNGEYQSGGFTDNGRVDCNGVNMHWTEFAKDTRVGWRGPMMLWERLGSGDAVQWSHAAIQQRDANRRPRRCQCTIV